MFHFDDPHVNPLLADELSGMCSRTGFADESPASDADAAFVAEMTAQDDAAEAATLLDDGFPDDEARRGYDEFLASLPEPTEAEMEAQYAAHLEETRKPLHACVGGTLYAVRPWPKSPRRWFEVYEVATNEPVGPYPSWDDACAACARMNQRWGTSAA